VPGDRVDALHPGDPEGIRDLIGVHRVGSVIPEPGTRYPVYLVIRSSAPSYAEAFGALVARQGGRPFSAIVPTGRFLTDDLEQQMRSRGVAVIALADVLEAKAGRMVVRTDPQQLFSGLGAPVSAAGLAPALVGRAILRDRAQPPRWVDLDDAAYRNLLTAVDRYDVLADERQRSVWKGAKVETGVQRSHFRSINAALTCAGYYDPNVAGPELTAGKQIFQRARKSFDIKAGGSSWKIFKSIRTEEKHTVYTFQPDPDVSFAFIFLPHEQ
jgi:hypothetical protein